MARLWRTTAHADHVLMANLPPLSVVMRRGNARLTCGVVVIRDNGILALESLMKRQGTFDCVLLETTGMADPGTTPEKLLPLPCHGGGMSAAAEANLPRLRRSALPPVVPSAPIAKIFWQDEALQGGVYLDGIVTVIDARNVLRVRTRARSRARYAAPPTQFLTAGCHACRRLPVPRAAKRW